MSFTSDLLEGVAQRLADNGAGVYLPTGAYGPGDVAIVFRVLPQDPDRAIALSTYDFGHDLTQPDSLIGLQLRIRGTTDPLSDGEIDDVCFDVLHGLWAVDLGGVIAVSAWRQSGASLGPDESGRFVRTSNYHLQMHRPSPNRV